MTDSYSCLPAFDPRSGTLNAIIETPKGHRNKFSFDQGRGLFMLGGVLPAGAVFPYDFGLIPATLGEDGDPLDVLILMDEAAFPGILVPSRLLGVIEAEQTEAGKTEKNDRILAVADNSRTHKELRSIEQVDQALLGEIEHFFVSYNVAKGKRFEVLGRAGPDRAQRLVEEGAVRRRDGSK